MAADPRGAALELTRKRARGGVWVVRVYKGGKYSKCNIGRADETEGADRETVLSFKQAERRAIEREYAPKQVFTVADAMRDYLGWYATHRKALRRTGSIVTVHILPSLGSRIVAEMTTPEIRQWHESIAIARARLRTVRFSKAVNTREGEARARRATANRILTVLKAALNHAWRDGSAPLDEAWQRVKPFQRVDAPKVRYLNTEECRRLINACVPDFRQLVQAALLTGCRYGELIAMRVSDYHPEPGTAFVAESKSGKPRHVPLTDEGRDFFAHAAVGRLGNDLLFIRPDGMAWGGSHQQRPLQRACSIAKIEPVASFHVLRHSYGSMLAMRGVPLQVIAEALEHSDTRVTSRHYAHLLPSYVADTIRAAASHFAAKRLKKVNKPQH